MLRIAQQVLRILLWQAGLVIVAGGTMWMVMGPRWAWSILAGGGIGWLGTSYLMVVVIRRSVQVTRPATLSSVLVIWLIKTMVSAGLLTIAMRSRALVPLAVILGLCGSLLAYWLYMMFDRVKYADNVDGK